ncbi:MAG TPA: hypothetical protein VNM72_11270 [Blastocatellia bacterium]|nr:hypothetical protein [Blastocatellia bacterium]
MKKRYTYLVHALLVITLCHPILGLAVQSEQATSLPIRRIVLYRHGVGYFERRGRVTGNVDVRLRFNAGQMSDVLKSLVVLDLGRGTVSAVAFDSSEPLERRLARFSVSPSTTEMLTSLASQLRGVRVEITTSAGTASGVITGFESRQVLKVSEALPEIVTRKYLVLLMDTGELRTFDFEELRSFRILNQQMAEEVKRYFEALHSSHQRDERTLRISAQGQGTRELVAAYTIEVPVWRTTYRIVMERGSRPLLQGWAIVYNTSDEDWTDVSLSLVSGLPVSFAYDLYQPRYMRRPEIRLAEELTVTPQTYESALGKPAEEKVTGEELMKQRALMGPPAAQPLMAREAVEAAVTPEAAARSITPTTVTRQIGELFEYRIDHPVTVLRGQSAMVPIVQAQIEATPVSLYNESARADHPMSGLRLTNTTDLTLEGGTVTVIEDGSYAGEALVETIRPREQRFISYAVDLGIDATTNRESRRDRAYRLVARGGSLSLHFYEIETKTYTLTNRSDRPRTVIVEHPYRSGWELSQEGEKPIEETPHFYRFQVEVPVRATKKLVVKERRTLTEEYRVGDLTPEQLSALIAGGSLDAETRRKLEEIMRVKAQIADLTARIEARTREMDQIFRDHQRIRGNLTALGQSEQERQLRSRYIEQITRDEERLARLRQENDRDEQERARLQNQLNDLIEKFAVDRRLT